MSHAFHRYLCRQLGSRLLQHRIVVFYDPRREFDAFFVETPRTTSGLGGLPRISFDTQPDLTPHLARFEGSMFGLRAAVEPFVEVANKPEYLIVYLPGVPRDAKGSVLMELERGGTCYEPQLKRLARNALREFYTDGDIDELLGSERVAYGDIAHFLTQSECGDGHVSMLRAIFGGASSEELLAKWLAKDVRDDAITEKGAANELFKLVRTRLGCELPSGTSVAVARDSTARYILVNEFRSDLTKEPSGVLSMIPAAAKDALDRIGDITSCLRGMYPDAYARLADQVEAALHLSPEDIDRAQLGSVDTFRFQEKVLLAQVGTLISGRAYEEALEIISSRSVSFWIDRDVHRRAQWEACRLMAELGQAVEEVGSGVSGLLSKAGADATHWVNAYASQTGWHRADLLHRSLEAWVAKMADEPEAEQALGVVRRHHEDVLKGMADGFSRALVKSGWAISHSLHQTRIYPDVVETMVGRTAYFFVDAMRFEMGVDLALQLDQFNNVGVRAAIAALPSITPLGMAALLPGASSEYSAVEHKGRLAACVGDTIMPTLAERRKHLRATRPDAKDIDLGDLLQRSTKSLERSLDDVPLLVVRSQSIDGLGEMDGGLLARHIMDTVVGNIARAVRKLAKLDFDAFVITADHGHQFSIRKGQDMLMDKPGGKTVDLHRRCWAGKGGQTPAGCLRVSGAELGYDTDLEFVFPSGLGVFRTGGDLAFHHGGISLQELVVPVVTLRLSPDEPSDHKVAQVQLTDVPTTVTNRTIGVRVVVSGDLLQTEPLALRAVLVSSGEVSPGEVVGQAGMALGAQFDRTTGILSAAPGDEFTVGLMLTRDDCEMVRVVIQNPKTDAVLVQSDELPVKLGI